MKYFTLYKIIAITFFIPTAHKLKAQQLDSLSRNKFAMIQMAENMNDRNFLALPAFGNVEPTLFEGNLTPHKFLKICNDKLLVDLYFQFTFRMLQLRSVPIRTPDYKPGISIYSILNKQNDGQPLYGFVTLGHHSNGQDGSFYDKESGNVNFLNGNFSTNFFKTGLSKLFTSTNVNYYLSAYLEQHVDVDRSMELNGIYGFTRLHIDCKSKGILNFIKRSKKSFLNKCDVAVNTTWIADKLKHTGLMDVSKRLVCSVKLSVHPEKVKNFSFFIQAYQGQDYYNVHFVDNISFVRIGLAVEPSILIHNSKI